MTEGYTLETIKLCLHNVNIILKNIETEKTRVIDRKVYWTEELRKLEEGEKECLNKKGC